MTMEDYETSLGDASVLQVRQSHYSPGQADWITGLGHRKVGVRFPIRKKHFSLCQRTAGPALTPIQPPVQWTSCKYIGEYMKLTTHFDLHRQLRMHACKFPLPRTSLGRAA